MQFQSLWLDFERTSWPKLQSNLQSDIVVVGAGISGVSTLYYLLTLTTKKVTLLERNFVASGATGHNGGLPTVYIERPFKEFVEEFGIHAVKQAYQEIDSGWQLLNEISEKIGFELLNIPVVYFGLPTLPVLMHFLKEHALSEQVAPFKWKYWVSDQEEIRNKIPSHYHPLIKWVSQDDISNALDIPNSNFIGLAQETSRRVRMNSALFCDQVLKYLAETFPERCQIFEDSEILKIELQEDQQILHHRHGKIAANETILCTNAYREFEIIAERSGKTVDKLKELVFQREGYMAAFSSQKSQSALIGYMNEANFHPAVAYWYLSTGPNPPNKYPSNICVVGGPEYTLSAPLTAEQISKQAEESLQLMKEFLSQRHEFPQTFPYFWHGTMGYTNNRLRWVGQDPDHLHLWYNLGCNGIGILPALAGAKKIARELKGEKFGPSLFDPPSSQSKFKS